MKRTLAVRKETLSRLGVGELAGVGGGQEIGYDVTRWSCLPTDCCTGMYPSINYPCTQELNEIIAIETQGC